MPYIHFTDEQKRQANAVDLVEFLRYKGEPLIRSGSEFRMSSNHSVTVGGNEWYDHAAEKGGGPVSFLKEFYGMNYQQVLDQDIGRLYSQVDTPQEKVKKEFVMLPANENNRRAFAYLLKHRHLDRDVLTAFVRLGLVYEDKGYHNAVFVGNDKDGTAVILLLAEFLPPKEIDGQLRGRHIVSVLGSAGAVPGQGKELFPGADEPSAIRPQSPMVRGGGAEHLGAGHGLGAVHRAVPAERFPVQMPASYGVWQNENLCVFTATQCLREFDTLLFGKTACK